MSKNKINPEDLILYAITTMLLAFLGWYFWSGLTAISKSFEFKEVSVPSEYSYLYENNKLKYYFSMKVLLANTMRNNMSFMIGSVLCILGSIVVVRRVRADTETNASQEKAFSFSFKSNSAGITIVFLGTLILLMSLLMKDKYDISDTSSSGTNIKGVPGSEKPSFDTARNIPWSNKPQ